MFGYYLVKAKDYKYVNEKAEILKQVREMLEFRSPIKILSNFLQQGIVPMLAFSINLLLGKFLSLC